jgi:hypothetical protein
MIPEVAAGVKQIFESWRACFRNQFIGSFYALPHRGNGLDFSPRIARSGLVPTFTPALLPLPCPLDS